MTRSNLYDLVVQGAWDWIDPDSQLALRIIFKVKAGPYRLARRSFPGFLKDQLGVGEHLYDLLGGHDDL